MYLSNSSYCNSNHLTRTKHLSFSVYKLMAFLTKLLFHLVFRPQEKHINLKEITLKLLPAAVLVLQNGLCMLILAPAGQGSAAGGTE